MTFPGAARHMRSMQLPGQTAQVCSHVCPGFKAPAQSRIGRVPQASPGASLYFPKRVSPYSEDSFLEGFQQRGCVIRFAFQEEVFWRFHGEDRWKREVSVMELS